jgi:Flp pilus assembly protein TadG
MLRLSSYLKNNRGQALVEFALVLPVLLLLVVGAMEFGLIINEYLVVTEAAREGARSAALGNSNATVIAAVNTAASQINTAKLTITIAPSTTRVTGSGVTVTVQKPVQAITGLISPFFPAGFTLQGVSTMLVE